MIVSENLEKVRLKIDQACRRANRRPEEIRVIAVTKYVSDERALAVLEAGIHDLGENRDDGFLNKWEKIGERATWHFIGTLQSRKVKKVIDKVDYIHSLDRLSLAKEIDKRAEHPVKCFVQVNVSGEETKHGLRAGDVVSFIEQLEAYKNIIVVGLMTMAPYTDDTEWIRDIFKRVRALQQTVKEKKFLHAPCTELSMGMSNDFEIAIEEGATFIRLGTALVGKEF